MHKPDRRVQRTRDLLHMAVLELIEEKGYYAVKIQDIIERANVGRTTFYAHFDGKEDLFVSAHIASMARTVSLEDLLAEEAPESLIRQFEISLQLRPLFMQLSQGIDFNHFRRNTIDRVARMFEEDLQPALAHRTLSLPLPMLCHFLVSSQVSFVDGWLTNNASASAAHMANVFQHIQRAIVREAIG